MSRRAARYSAVAVLVGASLIAVALSACGRNAGGGARFRPGARAADSSFAVVAFQRGRPPAKVAEEQGRIVYLRYCAICHGESGEGDGFNAYNVNGAFGVGPTAFADSAVFASLNEDTALSVIRDGGPAMGKSAAMPPWGHPLTPSEVMDLWQFIRSLPRKGRGE